MLKESLTQDPDHLLRTEIRVVKNQIHSRRKIFRRQNHSEVRGCVKTGFEARLAGGAWTSLSVTGSSGPVCRSMDDKAGQMHTQGHSETAHLPPPATPPGLGREERLAGHTGRCQSSAFLVAEATTCTSGRPHLWDTTLPPPCPHSRHQVWGPGCMGKPRLQRSLLF